MSAQLSRRALLAAAAASLGSAALAGAPARSLRPAARPGPPQAPSLAELLARADLGGAVSFVALDASSGALLEARQARLPQPPASALKAVTSAYALSALGAEHRFVTRLIASGAGSEPAALTLAGGGDPALTTLGAARLARAAGAAGLKGAGALRVWDGALPYVPKLDPDQLDELGYNPAISGLNLNYNRVHFSWSRAGGGYATALDAREGDLVPQVATSRIAIAPRERPVYTYAQEGGVDSWTVARAALGEGGSRWLPVRNPALYAGGVLSALARGQGLALGAPEAAGAPPEGTEIAREESPALPEMISDLLLYSTNITAEAMGLTASGAGSLSGSGAAMAAWGRARLGLEGASFVDHSGLSGENRISAAELAGAMARLGPGHPVAQRLHGFTMRDAERRVIEDHPVRVRAKTGTLNFVSALAGFATPPSGRQVAFAILCSDLPRRAAARGEEIPAGAREWNRRAKALQQGLIERWAMLYG